MILPNLRRWGDRDRGPFYLNRFTIRHKRSPFVLVSLYRRWANMKSREKVLGAQLEKVTKIADKRATKIAQLEARLDSAIALIDTIEARYEWLIRPRTGLQRADITHGKWVAYVSEKKGMCRLYDCRRDKVEDAIDAAIEIEARMKDVDDE